MDAKEFLKSLNIDDKIVNKCDLPEFQETISSLMEAYYIHKICVKQEDK